MLPFWSRSNVISQNQFNDFRRSDIYPCLLSGSVQVFLFTLLFFINLISSLWRGQWWGIFLLLPLRHCLQFEFGRHIIDTSQTLPLALIGCVDSGAVDSCKSNYSHWLEPQMVDFKTAYLYLILLSDHNDSFSKYNKKTLQTTALNAPVQWAQTFREVISICSVNTVRQLANLLNKPKQKLDVCTLTVWISLPRIW